MSDELKELMGMGGCMMLGCVVAAICVAGVIFSLAASIKWAFL